MAQCADLLNPLYVAAKKVLFGSKVIGTDDVTSAVISAGNRFWIWSTISSRSAVGPAL
jgi:hypothetical protein